MTPLRFLPALLLAALGLATGCAQSNAASARPPQALEIKLAGYRPVNYRIAWTGTRLLYVQEVRSGGERTTPIRPSSGAWGRFWRALERVEAWSWAPEYRPAASAPTEGLQWQVRIRWNGHTVSSQGIGRTPQRFGDVLEALSELLGGRPVR